MVFILFSNCKIVKGYKMSMIYDLHLSRFVHLANDLADILIKNNFSIDFSKINEIEDYKVLLKEFCDSLEKSDFGFFYSNPEEFPILSEYYEPNTELTNAIIFVNENNNYSLIIQNLCDLGCTTLSLVLKEYSIILQTIYDIIQLAHKRGIEYIEVYIPFPIEESYLIESVKKWIKINETVRRIVVYNSLWDKEIELIEKDYIAFIQFIKKMPFKIEDRFNPQGYFAINIPTFTESVKHNTYFNQKIFINEKLQIISNPI